MSLLDTAPAHSDALERLLGEVSVSIRSQRRVVPDADDAIVLDGLAFIYVLQGSIPAPSCAGTTDALEAGDVLLTAGRTLTLPVPAGSGVLISQLAWEDSAAHLEALMPDIAWIRGFAELEPAGAAIAQAVGHDETPAFTRGGDAVICRMLTTTLLQSVIRAWAGVGCAPQGWPSLTADPFLDRVIAAVEAQPGRDWTVEQMASVSALSRSVFAERFRLAFGVSPAQYVAGVRMRAARALLIDGRGVSEVSRELGYGSDDGFSRAFRRHTGMTPSAWRTRGALAPA